MSEDGAPPSSDIVRGGRFSLLEGGYGRDLRSPRQLPGLGSQSVPGWSEGSGALPALCRCTRRVPLPACSSGPSPPLVAGVVLALAFEPVGASCLIPFAVAGVRPGHPRAARAPRPGSRASPSASPSCYVLMFWMRVVGYDAWVALSALEASFYGLLGPGRRPCSPAAGAGRCWSPSPGWRWRRSGPAGRSAACPGAGSRTPRPGTPWEKALPYVGNSGVSLAAGAARHHAGLGRRRTRPSPAGPRRCRWAAARASRCCPRSRRTRPTCPTTRPSRSSRATCPATATTSCSTTAR